MSTAKPSYADTRRFGLDGATSPIGQTLQSKLRGLQTDETPPSSPDIIDEYLTIEEDIRRSDSGKSTTSNHSNSYQESTHRQGQSHVDRQQRTLGPLITSFPTTPQQDTFDPSLHVQSPAGSVPTLSSTTSPSLNSVYASPSLTLDPSILAKAASTTVTETRHLHRKVHIQKGDISDPVLIAKTYTFDTVDLPEGASLRNGADGGVDVVLADRVQHRRASENTFRLSTVRLVGPPSGNVVELE